MRPPPPPTHSLNRLADTVYRIVLLDEHWNMIDSLGETQTMGTASDVAYALSKLFEQIGSTRRAGYEPVPTIEQP